MDGGEVSEEEREEAWQFYLQSDAGKMMVEMEEKWSVKTDYKWCVGKWA